MLSRKSRKIRNKKQFKKRQKNVSKVIRGGSAANPDSDREICQKGVNSLMIEHLKENLKYIINYG